MILSRLVQTAVTMTLLAGTTSAISAPGIRFAPVTPPPVLHVRGGTMADLPVVVETDATGPIHLLGQLSQLSSSLTAPLGAVADLGSAPAFGRVTISLPIPHVASRTDVLVRFSARSASDPETPLAHGRLRLVVHPANSLDELRAFARRHPLGVFGQSPEIRAFLERERVTFKDLGEAPPRDPPVGLLVIGSSEDLLPAIRVVETPEATHRQVTFPPLPDLETAPLTQENFMLILNQSIQP